MVTAVSDFMENLPSFNPDNFKRFRSDNLNKTCIRTLAPYLATEEYPSDQVIVSDKTTVLLRHLHKYWDNKLQLKDRKRTNGQITEEVRSEKRARVV